MQYEIEVDDDEAEILRNGGRIKPEAIPAEDRLAVINALLKKLGEVNSHWENLVLEMNEYDE